MAETAGTATRVCPECGLDLPLSTRDCPCCGCAPGGTGLVDHLPPADNDNRLAPVALAIAGVVAGVAVLAAFSLVAAIVVAVAFLVLLAALALDRRV
jgi:hypothetical protein